MSTATTINGNVFGALTTDRFLNPVIPSARKTSGGKEAPPAKPRKARALSDAEQRVQDARRSIAQDAVDALRVANPTDDMAKWSKVRLLAHCHAQGMTGLSSLSRDNLQRKAEGLPIVKPAPKAGSLAALRAECVAEGMRKSLAARLDRDALTHFLETGETPDKPLTTREKLNALAKKYNIKGRTKMSTATLLDVLFGVSADAEIDSVIGAAKVKEIADRADRTAEIKRTGFAPGVSRDIVRFACIASGKETRGLKLNDRDNLPNVVALASEIVAAMESSRAARAAA